MNANLQMPSFEGRTIVGYCKYGDHEIYSTDERPYPSTDGTPICVAHLEREVGIFRASWLSRVSLAELVIGLFVKKSKPRLQKCDVKHVVGHCEKGNHAIYASRDSDEPTFVPLGEKKIVTCLRCLADELAQLRTPHQ